MDYSYQDKHITELITKLKRYRAVVDGSDMGTGKTHTAIRIALAMRLTPVIVCPKTVRESWQSVMNNYNITGYVNNYEQFKLYNTEYVITTGKKRQPFRWNINPSHLIIFDEVHVCGNFKTANSKLLLAAGSSPAKVLMLSATVADNPLKLEAIGALLELFRDRPGFYDYCFSRGAVRDPRGFGLLFRGKKSDLEKIHNDLFVRRGRRMRISEIPDFPKNQIIPALYDINNSDKIDHYYKQIKDLDERLKDKMSGDDSNILVERLRARQMIENLRLPLFVELITDLIEQGKSVVVFVNFTESITFLRDLFDCLTIHGDQSAQERSKNIEFFQADKKRIILCNIRAGGVGLSLHDINGIYPRVTLISPTDSAVDLIQATGRTARAGAKSEVIQYICYIAKTIEEKVYKNMIQKKDRIQTINDGDLKL